MSKKCLTKKLGNIKVNYQEMGYSLNFAMEMNNEDHLINVSYISTE